MSSPPPRPYASKCGHRTWLMRRLVWLPMAILFSNGNACRNLNGVWRIYASQCDDVAWSFVRVCLISYRGDIDTSMHILTPVLITPAYCSSHCRAQHSIADPSIRLQIRASISMMWHRRSGRTRFCAGCHHKRNLTICFTTLSTNGPPRTQ